MLNPEIIAKINSCQYFVKPEIINACKVLANEIDRKYDKLILKRLAYENILNILDCLSKV